jgi:hypothetical protein
LALSSRRVKHWFLYLPYLPLEDRVGIGEWRLIPAAVLSEEDAPVPLSLKLARGLVGLYERPPSYTTSGAFAQPSGGRVGDEFGLDEFGRLRRALVMTLLDQNPSGVKDQDKRNPNEAWRTYTSEHAQAWGHRIDEDGYVAEERGVMVSVLAGGYNVLQDDSIRLAYPRELHHVRPARQLDTEYGTALYGFLGEDSSGARRLERAIDWLELAWQNADALRLNLRIAAIHSGFETLLDKPADAKAAAQSLSALLDPPNVEKRARPEWRKRSGVPVDTEISDLGWWFVQFAQLRNAILHGDEITTEHHHDDLGRAHLWVGELTLRDAIKETVAAAGWPELREPVIVRAVNRALRQAETPRSRGFEGSP